MFKDFNVNFSGHFNQKATRRLKPDALQPAKLSHYSKS